MLMSKKNVAKVLMLVICGTFAGCASTASVTKLSSNQYDAKPKNCEIEVLTDEPARAHEKLGIVTASSGQTWWAAKGFDAMLPPMKEQACAIGADAIVVKQVEEGGVAWVAATQGKASAVAIKYKSAE